MRLNVGSRLKKIKHSLNERFLLAVNGQDDPTTRALAGCFDAMGHQFIIEFKYGAGGTGKSSFHIG